MGRVQWDPARCLLVGRAGEPAKHPETWRCGTARRLALSLECSGISWAENETFTYLFIYIYLHTFTSFTYCKVIQHGQLNIKTWTIERNNQL